MRPCTVGVALLAAAATAACGHETPATAPPAAAAPSSTAASTSASTPAELSAAIGCTREPGPGRPALEAVGATNYGCVGQRSDEDGFVGLVFFTSAGAQDVYVREHGGPDAPGQLVVVGPLWMVWGTDRAVIAAAIDHGGRQL